MNYSLELKEEFKKNISDAFLWYDKINSDLSQRFINEIEGCLFYVQKHPKHYQIKHKNYREAVLKVFPFVIIYEIFNSSVVVYALFPTKDNPTKKP